MTAWAKRRRPIAHESRRGCTRKTDVSLCILLLSTEVQIKNTFSKELNGNTDISIVNSESV